MVQESDSTGRKDLEKDTNISGEDATSMVADAKAMAPKKLLTKRARKDAAREGSSAAPQAEIEFDGHHFRKFQEKASRRQWTQLTKPMAKYDLEIVMEFYVNAWPTEEGVIDKRSWVRGQWIPYDEDAINQFLGHPLVLKEGQRCEFSERRSQVSGFDEEAIGQLLCSPGQDFARSVTGRRVWIMRTSITMLAQIWMTLLLSNILPSDHNFDLPLPKCQLVYAILTQFAGIMPPRHLVDPEKSNRPLGFPALITGLCQFYGVLVTPTKLIRPSINRSFIEKYCMPRPSFQAGAGPTEAPGDEDEAKENGDMADVMDFFL
ncbi:hypothetical protein HKD37_11G031835 [Glycine soja]